MGALTFDIFGRKFSRKKLISSNLRGIVLICFVLGCLFAFQTYARQITCPRCDGTGVILGPVLGGIQSYYGCPDCGGSGGGGSPGTKGCGRIELPDIPMVNLDDNQHDDTEAARQAAEAERQRALAEQEKKAREDAARRQAEFLKAKQEALSSMKGIADSEFGGLKGIATDNGFGGLKGVGKTTTGDLGLKEINDSSVVDLRHLDPNKPIVVDPNVVKGRERVFPVQLDPETYKNVNHNKGLEALLKDDPDLAVRYFEAAQKERPHDHIIHNMLLLAQDIAKAHRDNDAAYMMLKSYCAFMSGDPVMTKFYFKLASDRNPNNEMVRWVAPFMALNAKEIVQQANQNPASAQAYQHVGYGLTMWQWATQGNPESRDLNLLKAANESFKAAEALNPDDPVIKAVASGWRGFKSSDAGANSQK
jgi:hypothetical protein